MSVLRDRCVVYALLAGVSLVLLLLITKGGSSEFIPTPANSTSVIVEEIAGSLLVCDRRPGEALCTVDEDTLFVARPIDLISVCPVSEAGVLDGGILAYASVAENEIGLASFSLTSIHIVENSTTIGGVHCFRGNLGEIVLTVDYISTAFPPTLYTRIMNEEFMELSTKQILLVDPDLELPVLAARTRGKEVLRFYQQSGTVRFSYSNGTTSLPISRLVDVCRVSVGEDDGTAFIVCVMKVTEFVVFVLATLDGYQTLQADTGGSGYSLSPLVPFASRDAELVSLACSDPHAGSIVRSGYRAYGITGYAYALLRDATTVYTERTSLTLLHCTLV